MSLVALMAVGGLILDGSHSYAERRQMQNAADAGAMAGTRTLDRYKRGVAGADLIDIRADALAQVTANDGIASEFICEIVDINKTVIQPCPTSPGTVDATDWAGVKVRSGSTHKTFLMRVVGQDQFTARATATAQIQALRRVNIGNSPFMICAFGRYPDEGPPLVIDQGGKWVVNPAAIWSETGTAPAAYDSQLDGGPWYLIHGPNSDNVPGCGSDAEGFKGWVNEGGSFQIPGWWESQPGDRSGPAGQVLADYTQNCEDLEDCILVVPICIDGQGTGGNAELFCIRFGAFRVVDTGSGGSNNRHHVALISPEDPIITEGQGGGLPVDNEELRIIKLTD
jgi:Flp pilus assembly protein TadG